MDGNHQDSVPNTISLRQGRRANGSLGSRRIAKSAKKARAVKEAAAEADLLQMIIDSFPDLIYVKDTQSRFLISNLACARALGALHPKEIINKSDFDFFPKEFAERYFADEQALLKSGQSFNVMESLLEKTTGKIRWIHTTKVARRDGNGEITGIIGIGRDVTDLQRAREASNDELQKRTGQLFHERLLLRTLIDNLPDCIYAKDLAGRKTLANRADLKNLHCKTEAEAIGKSDFDFFSREIAEQFWADDQKVIQGKPVINREEYLPDGVWLLTSKLPLRDTAGRIVGLIGVGRDITQQKRMQTQLAYEQHLLHSLLENSPARIFFKDLESRFVRFSNSKAHGTLDSMRT
ncbi:MAG: PAS domain-containing protein, partial [Limisphaerales bacterium]